MLWRHQPATVQLTAPRPLRPAMRVRSCLLHIRHRTLLVSATSLATDIYI